MLAPPSPAVPLPPYQGLSLSSLLEKVLRAYPAVEDAVVKLCEDSVTRRAFHYYMVTEHYAGMCITQRGKTYYVTRVSSIRNTASYEQYSWVLWHDDQSGTSVDENPKVAYRLYSHKWMDWVTVKH